MSIAPNNIGKIFKITTRQSLVSRTYINECQLGTLQETYGYKIPTIETFTPVAPPKGVPEWHKIGRILMLGCAYQEMMVTQQSPGQMLKSFVSTELPGANFVNEFVRCHREKAAPVSSVYCQVHVGDKKILIGVVDGATLWSYKFSDEFTHAQWLTAVLTLRKRNLVTRAILCDFTTGSTMECNVELASLTIRTSPKFRNTANDNPLVFEPNPTRHNECVVSGHKRGYSPPPRKSISASSETYRKQANTEVLKKIAVFGFFGSAW